MERVYVVHQLFVHPREGSQLAFAEHAADKLRPLAGVWPEPAANGLTVMAVSEAALDAAAVLLDAVYGEGLVPGPRRVAYLQQPAMQPVMDVFVRAPSVHATEIMNDLDRRRAIRRFSALEGNAWVIRAEAPMATLLGYGRQLARLSRARADHWITFKRWEPLEPAYQYAYEVRENRTTQPVVG